MQFKVIYFITLAYRDSSLQERCVVNTYSQVLRGLRWSQGQIILQFALSQNGITMLSRLLTNKVFFFVPQYTLLDLKFCCAQKTYFFFFRAGQKYCKSKDYFSIMIFKFTVKIKQFCGLQLFFWKLQDYLDNNLTIILDVITKYVLLLQYNALQRNLLELQ